MVLIISLIAQVVFVSLVVCLPRLSFFTHWKPRKIGVGKRSRLTLDEMIRAYMNM